MNDGYSRQTKQRNKNGELQLWRVAMTCTCFASHALLLQHQFSKFGVFKRGARLMANGTQMLDAALNADYNLTLLWSINSCLLAK